MPKGCNAAYSYITLSTVADHICEHVKHEVELSNQEILDCPKASRGCNGGSVNQVFAWGKRKGFINNVCFPTKNEQGAKCPADHLTNNICRVNNNMYKVVDYCLASGAENIQREILKNGPVVG